MPKPLDEPSLTDEAIRQWSVHVVGETMTMSFNTYRQRLKYASRHFSRGGWESFTKSLQGTSFIEMLEAKQELSFVFADQRDVVIESQGVVAGRYQWALKVPATLRLKKDMIEDAKDITVDMVIVRSPRLENSQGVFIENWKMSDFSSGG